MPCAFRLDPAQRYPRIRCVMCQGVSILRIFASSGRLDMYIHEEQVHRCLCYCLSRGHPRLRCTRTMHLKETDRRREEWPAAIRGKRRGNQWDCGAWSELGKSRDSPWPLETRAPFFSDQFVSFPSTTTTQFLSQKMAEAKKGKTPAEFGSM